MANTKKVKIKELTTDEEIGTLYTAEALTVVGLSLESIPDLLGWIRQFTSLRAKYVVYLIKGEALNHFCNNTGNNAYPDDLNIVAVKLDDIKDPMCLAIPRFTIGGRWFTDVVDNNRRREREKGNK